MPLQIERPTLDAALFSFARAGHGLVLGRAGVGKSFSLSLLASALQSEDTPHLIVGVDDLGDATENDTRAALGYGETSFSEALEHLFSTGPHGTVIFDGFDAARNEAVRTRVLGFVRSAIHRAPEGWTVVVSVRSYDATKSPTLIALFPRTTAPTPTGFQRSGIVARHFLVPELTDDEVTKAITHISGLEKIYSHASDDFRRLARIPFNLWLLERILHGHVDTERLRQLHSEVQLLELYWSTHVVEVSDSEQRSKALRAATSAMIKSRSLNFRKSDVFSEDITASWHALFSDDVLTESGTGKQAAQFSHNILFDYAVSVLGIPDSATGLIAFLIEDFSRPLFLRPSLLYYFAQLWHTDRQRFWPAFWKLLDSNVIAVRLVSRLLPPYVVATESRSITDLEPLVQRCRELQDGGANAVLRVLQALRFAEFSDSSVWIQFSAQIATTPSRIFAWELATYLGRVLADPVNAARPDLRSLIGDASRRLFDWSWEHRGPEQPWYDTFAPALVLPLVLKTFDTDIGATGSIVRRTLTLLREPNFPLRYLNTLAEEIVPLASLDPDVVAEVCRAVFWHEETSDEPTSMGGIVLRLTSNRRQDFGMCQYALARDFATFLEKAPETALALGFDILNAYSLSEHVEPRIDANAAASLRRQTFIFRGVERSYVQDGSVSWSPLLSHEHEATIANALENFLVDCEITAERSVEIAAAHAETAYTWALLLTIGARAPALYADALFDLALSRPIQLGLDTRHLLASFVEAAAPYWSTVQSEQFQSSALSLKEATNDYDVRQQYRELASDLLLTRMPANLLSVGAAQERVDFLTKTESLPKNEPAFRYSSFSRVVTSEMWLAEQGVDITTPRNAFLLARATKVKAFGEAWANKVPPLEAIDAFLPEMIATLAAVQDEPLPGEATQKPPGDTAALAPQVLEHLWTHLSGAAYAFARATLDPASRASQVARQILLRSAEFPPPTVSEKRDAEFSSPSWSPSPRTESIQGLSSLAFNTSTDSTVAHVFVAFAGSPEPSERYLVASYLPNLYRYWPDLFWASIARRADEEANAAVVTGLIRAIWEATSRQDEKGLQVLHTLLPRWLTDDSSSLRQMIALSLVRMAFVRDDPWAWERLRDLHANLNREHKLFGEVIVDGIRLLSPGQDEGPEPLVDKRVVDWILDLLRSFRDSAQVARSHLDGGDRNISPSVKDPEAARTLGALHDLVGDMVRWTYFGARIDRKSEQGQSAWLAQLREYLELVRPILRAILSFSGADGADGLRPGAAHEFMQLLNIAVSFGPEEALEMAAATAVSALGSGYQFDSLAVKEVVCLVEVVLADHRDRLSEGKPLEDTLRLLDVFADAGWPDALRLVWRLDEVFR